VRSDRIKVGVDTGGTFTDFLVFADGSLRVYKCLSTPDDPSRAVLKGLRESLGREPQEFEGPVEIVHGSTVATNALLERKGAKTVLITNRGFEDLIEIGRQTRPEIYNLRVRRPPCLVPRALRIGVRERTLHDGRILQGIDGAELDRLRAFIVRKRPEALAVCLLHAYRNPSSERLLEKALLPLGLPLSLSSRILPEFREYERMSTTVVNAFLFSKMQSYLGRLESELGGTRLLIMQSGGGVISSRVAKEEPVQTLLSGPAGGVVGALHVGERLDRRRVISFDMGGTSTDVSLVDGGLRYTSRTEISGLPVGIAMIDIHTVGAGGGSIAWRDAGGALRVGPQSAGADPGPACYGVGEAATVTDANICLGRLDARFFLGGAMKIDPERAVRSLKRLGRSFGLGPREIALGIVEVSNAVMEKAIRVISVERGYDPREFALISFGGAGGLHSAELARRLGVPLVIVPRDPGLLSARGLMESDGVRHYAKSILRTQPPYDELQREYGELEARAAEEVRREGYDSEGLILERVLEARYRGQSHEIACEFGEAFIERFHERHRERNGYCDPARPVEVVNLRLRARHLTEKPCESPEPEGAEDPSPALLETKVACYGKESEPGGLYRRGRLRPGMRIRGPAVIVEYSATTLVPPGFGCRVDGWGNLLLSETAALHNPG
jgi:N-methylhydantoinase A